MEYTWKAYKELVDLIKDRGYTICNYLNYCNHNRVCIMRHDIDFDINKAVEMSDYEKQLGITSVYFVLIDSPLYNALSNDNVLNLKRIIENGSEIGLHVDASQSQNFDNLEKMITQYKEIVEAVILHGTIQTTLRAMSYHIPNDKLLNADNEIISGLVNVYSKKFFTEFKYISDSGHKWREDPKYVISSGIFSHIQCLTHPIWYMDEDRDIQFFFDKLSNDSVYRQKYLIDNFKCFKNIKELSCLD